MRPRRRPPPAGARRRGRDAHRSRAAAPCRARRDRGRGRRRRSSAVTGPVRASARRSTGWRELLERERPDELVLAEADFDEQTVLDVVQLAHRHGVKVKLAPTTTELLVHEGQYVPGQGVPLFELRPPMLTGVEWATKRAFDLVVVPRLRRRRDPALAPGRRGDQARLARAGALRRPADRGRRARVRDAQVPHDGRGRVRAAGGARGGERGDGGALQDPRRPPRHPGRAGAPTPLARRAAAARSTSFAAR